MANEPDFSGLAHWISEQERNGHVDGPREPPHHGGNGGGGEMEARVAKLEALAESTDRRLMTVETDLRDIRKDMRSDFRMTWAGIIALGLILGGAWYKMDQRLDGIDGRLGGIESTLRTISDKLAP